MTRRVYRPPIRDVWEDAGGRILNDRIYGWARATCPLHEDRTASASVSEETDRWRCFTCDLAGDSLDLIGKVRNVGFRAAVAIAETEYAEGGRKIQRPDKPVSSLLPHRKRNHKTGSKWVPPWTRI